MIDVIAELPWAPSANHAWRSTGKAVHQSADYRAFKRAVGQAIIVQRIPRHRAHGRLGVGLLCCPPAEFEYDIDNRVKTILDAVAAAGVIDNDKFIDLIVVGRGPVSAPHGAIFIHIAEMEGRDWSHPLLSFDLTGRVLGLNGKTGAVHGQ
jgi:Holliday junction resolvase RusA-like endonuclease